MSRIHKQILKEKMKPYPIKQLIQRLQVLIDKDEITFDDFCGSGRYEDKSSYQYVNKNTNLQHDCTDVVVYCGEYVIQLLINRKYYYNGFTDISLENVEHHLWTTEADAELNDK